MPGYRCGDSGCGVIQTRLARGSQLSPSKHSLFRFRFKYMPHSWSRRDVVSRRPRPQGVRSAFADAVIYRWRCVVLIGLYLRFVLSTHIDHRSLRTALRVLVRRVTQRIMKRARPRAPRKLGWLPVCKLAGSGRWTSGIWIDGLLMVRLRRRGPPWLSSCCTAIASETGAPNLCNPYPSRGSPAACPGPPAAGTAAAWHQEVHRRQAGHFNELDVMKFSSEISH